MTENKRHIGIGLALTTATMWGVMGLFVRKMSGEGLGSIEISLLRSGIACVIYAIILSFTNRSAFKVDGKGLVSCLIYGVFGYAFCFVTYNISITMIPISVAMVLMFMTPIWVVIISIVFFKEKVSRQKITAIIICMIGAILITDVLNASGEAIHPLGILTGVLNGFGVALQVCIPKFFGGKYQKDTMIVYGFLGSALALCLVADFSNITTAFATGDTTVLLINIFAIAILCSVVASSCYLKATNYIDATTTTIILVLEVVIGGIMAYFCFDELLSTTQMIGAVIIVLGALSAEIAIPFLGKKKEQ